MTAQPTSTSATQMQKKSDALLDADTSQHSPNQPRKKVALGMSGGVDSSVCAHLLVEQGYDVTGVFMECWRAPGCRTDQDRKDALKVALNLSIPFEVLDFKRTYKDKVVELFFADYEAGLTPNPDILCNKEIKFGLFYDWAMANEFDYIATGHYAKIEQFLTPNQASSSTLSNHLTIPADTHKDQTYFLYPITENQLNHTIFPLQDLTKDQVRNKAKELGLHNATKKDSVGICFIGDINVHDFLRERLGENPGEVVNKDGVVIGSHQGLWFYTIGQRHGFKINKKTVYTLDNGNTITKENIPPFYVIEKRAESNQLVVGFGSDGQKNIISIHKLHLINQQYRLMLEKHNTDSSRKSVRDSFTNSLNGALYVRIRHTGKLVSVKTVTILKKDQANQPVEVQLTTHQSLSGISDG